MSRFLKFKKFRGHLRDKPKSSGRIFLELASLAACYPTARVTCVKVTSGSLSIKRWHEFSQKQLSPELLLQRESKIQSCTCYFWAKSSGNVPLAARHLDIYVNSDFLSWRLEKSVMIFMRLSPEFSGLRPESSIFEITNKVRRVDPAAGVPPYLLGTWRRQ